MTSQTDLLSHNTLSAEQLAALLLFSHRLSTQKTAADVAWLTVQFAADALSLSDCVFYAMHIQQTSVLQIAAYGAKNPEGDEILNQLEIPLGQGIVGAVAKTGVAERIGNTSHDARYIVDVEPQLSEMAVPIIARGEVVGVIDTEHAEENYYSDTQFAHLKLIAAQVAPILYSILLEARVSSKDYARAATSNFLRIMKHNLMTPVSVILMKSQLLQRNIYGELAAKQSKAVGQITDSSKTIAALVEDIFEYVNGESGQDPLKVETIATATLVNMLFGKLQRMADSAQLALDASNGIQRTTLDVDLDLIVKAAKRISLVVCQDMQAYDELTVRITDADNQLTIAFSNQLEALTQADVQRMLRPFGQIRDDQENMLNTRHGLELTLARQAIKRHQGEFNIVSKVGSNRFVMVIPLG